MDDEQKSKPEKKSHCIISKKRIETSFFPQEKKKERKGKKKT